MINKQNLAILLSGIACIFIALYLFTRPAISGIWDFSNTGQVGDTIGGITAPVINLIGAFLVYISFKEQIKANKIQTDALENEKQTNNRKDTFERYITQESEIKTRLHDLDFIIEHPYHNNSDNSFSQPVYVTYRGLSALHEAVNRLESLNNRISIYTGQRYDTYSIFLNFQFILATLDELTNRIEKDVSEKDDKEFLINNLKTFYNIYLAKFGDRIINVYSKEEPEIKEFTIIKLKIDEKFKPKDD